MDMTAVLHAYPVKQHIVRKAKPRPVRMAD
jgi:hypothetical protein